MTWWTWAARAVLLTMLGGGMVLVIVAAYLHARERYERRRHE